MIDVVNIKIGSNGDFIVAGLEFLLNCLNINFPDPYNLSV
jgi:hypothetical protein